MSQRTESAVRLVILIAIGTMAGAAAFTHVHDLSVAHGQPHWIGWANAVAVELMAIYLGLEIRARRRAGRSVGLVGSLLVAFALLSLAPRWRKPNRRCGAGSWRRCRRWRSSPWSRSSCPTPRSRHRPSSRTNRSRIDTTNRSRLPRSNRSARPSRRRPSSRLRRRFCLRVASSSPTGRTSSGSSDDRADPARPRASRPDPGCSSAGVAGGPHGASPLGRRAQGDRG